ncbi:hypothetical protein D9V32_13895 [Mycetocola tolaasinivorans]|uniref:Pilus assembly protein n=1 Tax=Mycetocola tolaasinivorans TaxID=76635 RepID=A0A3L7A3M1_9MICO|nr:TadE family type IV pilus minor pilin [Mycetocola tolaasinivorans]RLP74131.1 hypothetical protein D9V32_13895 [Mycetocola tolaasinivorans]
MRVSGVNTPVLAGHARSDSGSVTAELALALPVVLIVLALCVATLSIGSAQGQLWDVAGQSARAFARGDSASQVAQRANQLVPGSTVTREVVGPDLVCARVRLALSSVLSRFLSEPLNVRSCTLSESVTTRTAPA